MADLGICCFSSLLISSPFGQRKTVIIQISCRPEVLSGWMVWSIHSSQQYQYLLYLCKILLKSSGISWQYHLFVSFKHCHLIPWNIAVTKNLLGSEVPAEMHSQTCPFFLSCKQLSCTYRGNCTENPFQRSGRIVFHIITGISNVLLTCYFYFLFILKLFYTVLFYMCQNIFSAFPW